MKTKNKTNWVGILKATLAWGLWMLLLTACAIRDLLYPMLIKLYNKCAGRGVTPEDNPCGLTKKTPRMEYYAKETTEVNTDTGSEPCQDPPKPVDVQDAGYGMM